MAVTKPIHELKDQLSRIVAEVAAGGEEVLITKHGRVVAKLVPPDHGVVFGVDRRDSADVPGLDELGWSGAEIDDLLDSPTVPT